MMAVILFWIKGPVALPAPGPAITDVSRALWSERQLDLLGQVFVLLAGAFCVVVLFKEVGKKA